MPHKPGAAGDPPERTAPPTPARHHVRLPGFLVKEERGLGEVLAKASTVARIRPCGGCRQRADTLDRWMRLTPRR